MGRAPGATFRLSRARSVSAGAPVGGAPVKASDPDLPKAARGGATGYGPRGQGPLVAAHGVRHAGTASAFGGMILPVLPGADRRGAWMGGTEVPKGTAGESKKTPRARGESPLRRSENGNGSRQVPSRV